MEKLMSDTDSSIFSPSPSIDPSIKAKLGTLNPITLKKVLRAYIGANVILSTISGKQPGVVEKETFIKEKINQKGINADLNVLVNKIAWSYFSVRNTHAN